MKNIILFMLNLIQFGKRFVYEYLMRNAEIREYPSEKNGEGRMGWQRRGG